MDSESKLVSLISQLIYLDDTMGSDYGSDYCSEVISLITQIIYLVNSMELDSHTTPESEVISLTTQTTSLFNSMNLDSQPEPLWELISIISKQKLVPDSDFKSLVRETLTLEPEPELISLIHQMFSLVIVMDSKRDRFISLSPEVQVGFEHGKFHLTEQDFRRSSSSSNNKWDCLPFSWEKFRLLGEGVTHFRCSGCNGENHKEYGKAPVEIRHPLHPKHYLQLVLSLHYTSTRECYCCDKDLNKIFYYCPACDFAINLACVEKPLVLSVDHPKWHEHKLTLFPRCTSLTCDVCGFSDPSSPFYVCTPCGFAVHQKCTNLPRVLRISRHPHRINFTPSFDKGDWSCGVCRKQINSDYGGYSCINDSCSSYAVHTQCATRNDVWDYKEHEGDLNEEAKPFVVISDGIIEHFSHLHHHLRLDQDTSRDYEENKLCQACITPIYFSNFYSCMQCEFILHEKCAHSPRKISHSLHQHLLTLVGGYDGVINDENNCSACPWLCTAGFFYKCGRERCSFKLHMQCATTSKRLVHETHMHALDLKPKLGEERICSVCKQSGHCSTNATFNCIQNCDFYLCFKCATLPQKVRYTDDEHMLTLSYGETSTMVLWCEECEVEIDEKKQFYTCDDCCVTLHIECLLGVDLYMMPGSSWLYYGSKVDVLPNNCSSRPFCSNCLMRCPHKIFLQRSGFIFCSTLCIHDSVDRGDKIA